MIQEFTSSVFYSGWPFWALSLTPDASAQEISHAVRNISAQLKLGVDHAKNFDTPMGVRERDEYLLREAKALLENPEQRLIAELWFTPVTTDQDGDEGAIENTDAETIESNLQWNDELKLP